MKTNRLEGIAEITPSVDGARKQKAASAKAKRAVSGAQPRNYYASIHPGPQVPLPQQFVDQVLTLESLIEMPIWVIIQNEMDGPWSEIGVDLFKGFQQSRDEMTQGKPLALLIDCPGGDAHCAYRIARMLQRRTDNKVTVILPQCAKSAATILVLGAATLIFGRGAELGPLDVQMFDVEREALGSALDAVQSLERLNAFALNAIDQTMFLLIRRTSKRTDVLLPHVLSYMAHFLRPLLEKIDTLDYTRKSRELKVAEEYAARLMRPNYSWSEARRIARQLVERYPTHGFVIDYDEVAILTPVTQQETFGLGLKLCKNLPKKEEVESLMENMIPFLDTLTIAGRITSEKPK